MVTRPKALLFDLDGTLVDSRRDIADALNFALTAVEREPLALEAVLPLVGDGARVLVTRALTEHASAPSAELIERALEIFQTRYRERPCVHTTLLPGAREALAFPLPRAVVTNKPRDITELVLASLAIEVDALYAGGDGTLKPAPDGILATASRLGVDAKDTWMIGDGPQDIVAGKAAGAFTIFVAGIAEPSRALAAEPDRVVASLLELGALLAGLTGEA